MKVYNKIEHTIIDIKNEHVNLILQTYPNIFELYNFATHGALPSNSLKTSFDVSNPNLTTNDIQFVNCLDESINISNGFSVKTGNKVFVIVEIRYKMSLGGADNGVSFELLKKNNGVLGTINGGFANEVFEARTGSNALNSLPINTITITCLDSEIVEGSYGVLVNVRADLGSTVLVQSIKRTLIEIQG